MSASPAIVVGASGGIGAALAEALTDEDRAVTGLARSLWMAPALQG